MEIVGETVGGGTGATGWIGVAALRAGLRSAGLRCAGRRFGFASGEVSGEPFGMSMDTEIQKHYALLLGIGSPWEVKTVELKLTERKVEIELGWQWGKAAQCPECQRECSIHDCAPERTWRHLDTMQFTTLIRARTRCRWTRRCQTARSSTAADQRRFNAVA